MTVVPLANHPPRSPTTTSRLPTHHPAPPRPTVGKNTTYLSIYESNSSDATPHLLALLSSSLTSQGIAHRIISERTPGRHWPHSASAERIAYLAHARNRALEPLASEDPEVRVLAGTAWEEEGKVVFLNDVVFEARQVVELLESRLEGELESEVDAGGGGAGGYDLACGMDYGWSGAFFSSVCLG